MVSFLAFLIIFFTSSAQAAFFGQADILINGAAPASTNPLGVRLSDGTNFLAALTVTSVDGLKATYSAAATGIVSASTELRLN